MSVVVRLIKPSMARTDPDRWIFLHAIANERSELPTIASRLLSNKSDFDPYQCAINLAEVSSDLTHKTPAHMFLQTVHGRHVYHHCGALSNQIG